MTAEARPGKTSNVLVIAVGSYSDPSLDREAVELAAQEVVDLFGDSHTVVSPPLIGGPTAEEVIASLTSWGGGDPDRPHTGLLLWTGHADTDTRGNPRLYAADRQMRPLEIGQILAELADSGMREWIVVLDCCYGFSAGGPIATSLKEMAGLTPGARYAVVTATDSLDEANAGLFTTAISEVLRRGPEENWWSFSDSFLRWDLFIDRLEEQLTEPFMALTGGAASMGRIVPNPLYREKGVIAGSFDEEHFLPKAQGIEAGDSGWYFTGRRGVLNSVLRWIRSDQGSIFVLTGSAGAGKSAIMGRLITLSVPSYREMAPQHVLTDAPVPELGDIQLAFHAREKRVEDLLAFLAEGVNAEAYRDVSDLYAPLQLAAAEHDRPYVIAVDALDEAMGDHGRHMVNEVLSKIGRLPNVKVLIGSRPGVIEWERLGVTNNEIRDLDLDPQTRADIADYVARRLPRIVGSTYSGKSSGELSKIGAAVAEASTTAVPGGREIGSFLVARVISKTLASADPIDTAVTGWKTNLPRGLGAAFEEDLRAYGTRHGEEVERLIRDLLEGLAWDEGQGIPRQHIPLITRAVTGHTYQDADITTLLRLAGGHIVEAEQDGWAIYRLYHQRFREHLRGVTRARIANEDIAP